MPTFDPDDLSASVWNDSRSDDNVINVQPNNENNGLNQFFGDSRENESAEFISADKLVLSELADTFKVLDIEHRRLDSKPNSLLTDHNPFNTDSGIKSKHGLGLTTENTSIMESHPWENKVDIGITNDKYSENNETLLDNLAPLKGDEQDSLFTIKKEDDFTIRENELLFSDSSPVKIAPTMDTNISVSISSPTKQNLKGKFLYKNKKLPSKKSDNSNVIIDPLSTSQTMLQNSKKPLKVSAGETTLQQFTEQSTLNIISENRTEETTTLKNNELEVDASQQHAIYQKFEIKVINPQKISELSSSYVEYTIITKSEALTPPDAEVSRRYSDIRWLYRQLQHTYWGKIIPVPPEKQVIGRFENNFIEIRRSQMETMLNEIASDPVLQKDQSFQMFLTTIDIINEKRNKENETDSRASSDSNDLSEIYIDEIKLLGREDGMRVIRQGGLDSKYKSSLINLSFNIAPKYVENDKYFSNCKRRMKLLEGKLQELYDSLLLINTENLDLFESITHFSNLLTSFDLDENNHLSEILQNFGTVHKDICKVQNYYNKGANSQFIFSLDSYRRSILSVYAVLNQRSKVGYYLMITKNELSRIEKSIISIKNNSLVSNDNNKLRELNDNRTLVLTRLKNIEGHFIKLEKMIKNEVALFDKKHGDNIVDNISTYIELSITCQQKVIELWHRFYEHNL